MIPQTGENSAGEPGGWQWSVGVRLQPLLEQRAASGGRVARNVTCHPSDSRPEVMRFHLGLIAAAEAAGRPT